MSQDNVPHQGEITVNAIVYKQMPNGLFSPEAVWSESVSVKFQGQTAQECIEELKKKIGALKGNDSATV